MIRPLFFHSTQYTRSTHRHAIELTLELAFPTNKMVPQKKKMRTMTSCLRYFENPLIIKLISDSFGDDKQSLRMSDAADIVNTTSDKNRAYTRDALATFQLIHESNREGH